MYLKHKDKLKNIKIYIDSKEHKSSDIIYFGHIIIENYRTWAYFTGKQIESIIRKKDLVKNNEEYNKTSSNISNKENAKKNKIFFNTLLYHLAYRGVDEAYSEYRASEIIKNNKKSISLYKKANQWNFILSDYNEIVLGGRRTNLLKFKYFTFSNAIDFNLCFTDKEDFFDKISPNFKNKGDNRLFKKFFFQNKIYTERSSNMINIKLIKVLLFIKKVFDKYEFKSFNEFKNTLVHTYKNNGCYRHEIASVIDKEYKLDRFTYILNMLSNKSVLKTYMQWRFYSGYHKEIYLDIKNMIKEGVDFSQYKNPFEAYHYLSRLRTKSFKENVNLRNSLEYRYYGEDRKSIFEEIIYSEDIKLVPILDFKTLCFTGNRLHNCAGSFETIEYYKKSISFQVLEDDELKFLGSIINGRLTQLKGYRNKSPKIEMFNKVINLLIENDIIIKNEYDYKNICTQIYR